MLLLMNNSIFKKKKNNPDQKFSNAAYHLADIDKEFFKKPLKMKT